MISRPQLCHTGSTKLQTACLCGDCWKAATRGCTAWSSLSWVQTTQPIGALVACEVPRLHMPLRTLSAHQQCSHSLHDCHLKNVRYRGKQEEPRTLWSLPPPFLSPPPRAPCACCISCTHARMEPQCCACELLCRATGTPLQCRSCCLRAYLVDEHAMCQLQLSRCVRRLRLTPQRGTNERASLPPTRQVTQAMANCTSKAHGKGGGARTSLPSFLPPFWSPPIMPSTWPMICTPLLRVSGRG